MRSKLPIVLVQAAAIGFLLVASVTAQAQTNSWIGGGFGTWETASDWSLGVLPTKYAVSDPDHQCRDQRGHDQFLHFRRHAIHQQSYNQRARGIDQYLGAYCGVDTIDSAE